MLGNGLRKAVRHTIQRRFPRNGSKAPIRFAHHRPQQAVLEPERLTQGHAFGTKSAQIGWMPGITGDDGATLHIGLCDYPAADTAIRACCAYRRRMLGWSVH
jgi:hypothetical protein